MGTVACCCSIHPGPEIPLPHLERGPRRANVGAHPTSHLPPPLCVDAPPLSGAVGLAVSKVRPGGATAGAGARTGRPKGLSSSCTGSPLPGIR